MPEEHALRPIMRLAFIYKQDNVFYSGRHFDNNFYNFCFRALRRSSELDVSYHVFDDVFDVMNLKNQADVLLIDDNPLYLPTKYKNIEKAGIPVIVRAGDPHYNKYTKSHYDYVPDVCFSFQPPSYFYKFYPKDLRYEMIVFGVEPDLYSQLPSFRDRIKGKILNSGTSGHQHLSGRIKEWLKQPDSHGWKHYRLRTLCNRLPYVDYTPTLMHEYVGDRYPKLLMKYRAAIAATTSYPTIKYWEIPAAGCLTFMEITEQNDGKVLGHKDTETAVFISEQNYKDKFEEYLSDPDNTKWERIAQAGRQYTMDNFTNDKAVDRLLQIIKSLG